MREIESVKGENGKVKWYIEGVEGWDFSTEREAEEFRDSECY